MNVVWDPDKAKSNLKKHGVDFADAAVSLEDPNALTITDNEASEYRFKTLALSPNTSILLIVHAEQDEETIRIISARHAEKDEEQQYFRGNYNE
jgi:uncharacterized DUF497 family protein